MSKEQASKILADLRKEIARLRALKSISIPRSEINGSRSGKSRGELLQRNPPTTDGTNAAYHEAIRSLDFKIEELTALYGSLKGERFLVEGNQQPLEEKLESSQGVSNSDSDAGDDDDRIAELEEMLQNANAINQRLANELSLGRKKGSSSSSASIRRKPRSGPKLREKSMIRYENYLPNGIEPALSRGSSKRGSRSLRDQNEKLRQALAREKARFHSAEGEIEELTSELESLHCQLKILRREAHQNKFQIKELSSKIAKLKGPDSVQAMNAMSWEERKQILLEQLEAESEVSTRDRNDELLEIKGVVEETTELLRMKDTEIKNLIKLVEEQSISSDSLAIGAAAVGEAVHLDDLIRAEQQKLRNLQEQWEERQRQFEIEMSLERAKLARDRLELQDELCAKMSEQAQMAFESSNAPTMKPRKRGPTKWFRQLGLED